MSDPQTRFHELIAALKERACRLTPQRVELVRLIASGEGHPSAAQLHARIKAQFPSLSQATVYKTLALLKDMGQVLEIVLRDDSHYDGNRPRLHPHGSASSAIRSSMGRRISIRLGSGNLSGHRVTRSSVPRSHSTGFALIAHKAADKPSLFRPHRIIIIS